MDYYNPKKIDDLICHSKEIGMIKTWLERFEKEKSKDKKKIKGSLLLTGGYGAGKTVSVRIVVEEMGYDIVKLDLDNLCSVPTVREIVDDDIIDIVEGRTKNVAVVIDDLGSSISKNEKAKIQEIIKDNSEDWCCPVIVISDGQYNPFLATLRRLCYEVKFKTPSFVEMKRVLVKMISRNKGKITDSGILKAMVDYSQGDLRRLVNTVQDILGLYSDRRITPERLKRYFITSKRKDMDVNMFKATEELMYNYTGMDECMRYYETDRNILPLMIHQNYIKSIMSNCPVSKRYEAISKISNFLAEGDVIENYIYKDQGWDLLELHGFNICVAPSFYLNKYFKKNPTMLRTQFPLEMTRSSMKYKNRDRIKELNDSFGSMDPYDYINIRGIIVYLLKKGDIDKLMEALKGYEIGVEEIEDILKLDYMATDTKLTAKQKKDIKKCLVEE